MRFGISIALGLIINISLSTRSNCEGASTITNIFEVQCTKQRFSRSSTEAGMFPPVNAEHVQSAQVSICWISDNLSNERVRKDSQE
jgi:hypothetical protein